MKRLLLVLLGVVILAAGVSIGVHFVRNKPKAGRKMRARLTPIVECETMTKGEQSVTLELLGQVIPARQVLLQSRVAGELVGVHANWIEGGRVAQGDVMARIDPADYRIAVTQAVAELAQARSDALLEQGRQDVARAEWGMLGDSVQGDDSDETLALRVPQQQAAEARVVSAEAHVVRARLDLERTVIKAPFNLVIMERHANVGDQVSAQSKLASVVDSDCYHVRVSVPVDDLKWIVLPGDGVAGSLAEIVLPSGGSCTGRVIGRQEDLEPNGRMARVLVSVESPLETDVPLLVDSFVSVRITGRCVDEAYAVPRVAFRDNARIWLLTETNTLHVISVDPVWTSQDRVVFRADIADGERLVTSALGVAIDGMELRVAGEGAKGAGRKPGKRK